MSNSDRFAGTCPEGHPTVEVQQDRERRWLHCTTCGYVSEPWQESATEPTEVILPCTRCGTDIADCDGRDCCGRCVHEWLSPGGGRVILSEMSAT